MCGAIRNEFELYTTLSALIECRTEGLLEGIVISTWVGEVRNISGLEEKLKTLNIYLIEIPTISESISQFSDINFARQIIQLRKGLEFIPDDVFVLKCRTDYSQDKIAASKQIPEGKIDMSLGSFGNMDFGLNYRIGVMRFSCNSFLTLVDSGSVGYKQDLLKMRVFVVALR